MAGSEEVTSGTGRSKASRTTVLFDIRTIIGVLFLVYGAVCVVWGLAFYGAADQRRSGDINVNLWAGLAMLVVAGLMIGWSVARPIVPPTEEEVARQQGTE